MCGRVEVWRRVRPEGSLGVGSEVVEVEVAVEVEEGAVRFIACARIGPPESSKHTISLREYNETYGSYANLY